MTTPEFHAHFIPALGMPALCRDGVNHCMTIVETEGLIEEMQMAVLQARIAAKRLSAERRNRTPDDELAELERSFDAQFAAVFSPSDSSPASEVSP
jgi:hypothetical protein